MADKPTEPIADLDLLDGSENFDPEAGTPVAPQIVKFVDTAHTAWLVDNEVWRATPWLSDIKSAREIVDEARRYGSKVREVKVTMQVRGYEENAQGQARVIYRVRDKVQSGRKPNLSPQLSK